MFKPAKIDKSSPKRNPTPAPAPTVERFPRSNYGSSYIGQPQLFSSESLMNKWKDLSQKYNSSNTPSSTKSKSIEEFKEDLISETTPQVANNSPTKPLIYQASTDMYQHFQMPSERAMILQQP